MDGVNAAATIYTYPSPAKINLFLRICDQRADGYHELQTAFQFLDWYDELQFKLRDDTQINITDNLPAQTIPTENNLIFRAVIALQKATNIPRGIDIHCEKQIPMGAGLGGGSSNAATTLHALNQLWECGFSTAELIHIGVQLGADVPIFLYGHAAWAEGIGERFTPLPDLPESWLCVLVPQVHVATGLIFRHPDLVRHNPPYPQGELPPQHTNDCEPLVRTLYPEIAQALDWLNSHNFAWLTGTGCAIVSAFESQAAAQAVCEQISPPWRGFVTKSCNASSLLRAINAL